MSASREKKIRQDLAAQGVTDPKKIREAEEKAKARKNNILYGVIAGVFVTWPRYCWCITPACCSAAPPP